MRSGGYQDFPSKFLCLRLPETLVGENLCAVSQKVSVSEKDYG